MLNATAIKKEVYIANKNLHKLNLAIQNFGNVSGRIKDKFYIKQSGLNINKAKIENMVCVDIIEGTYKGKINPSVDTPAHIELYRQYNEIGSIVHTHSKFATTWAQSMNSIPCIGTTHADFSKSDIPVTRKLKKNELSEYEKNIGKVIIETLIKNKLTPIECPAVLVSQHGPFVWGRTIKEAIKNAELLEYIAEISWLSKQLAIKGSVKLDKNLHAKHYTRKNGLTAYYGQNND